MSFHGVGHPFTNEGMARCCDALGSTPAEIWAVLTVETRGFGFLPDRRPQILFERHIFSRRTERRFDAVNPNVSNPVPGGYAGGAAEYSRLEVAIIFDRQRALESASWGIAQIMGFNHRSAGYSTVEAMVAAMVASEEAQLLAMANFIKSSGLDGTLRRKDWAAFAEGYNGKDFKKNQYDVRLAGAHARWQAMLPDLDLRAAQAALGYLGYDAGPVDGLRGRRTRSALIEFQQSKNLVPTGELDETTKTLLLASAYPAQRAAAG
jgi:hypothetical protein